MPNQRVILNRGNPVRWELYKDLENRIKILDTEINKIEVNVGAHWLDTISNSDKISFNSDSILEAMLGHLSVEPGAHDCYLFVYFTAGSGLGNGVAKTKLDFVSWPVNE